MRNLNLDKFEALVQSRERAASRAALDPFSTLDDRSATAPVDAISSAFTDRLLDGPFYESLLRNGLPAVNLVFVQSRDGNTEAENPGALGGGETDKHVIYEGLTRVTADAVLSGSKTLGTSNFILSVWHPELVRLRASSGKPRHPVQIVLTTKGEVPIEDGLLYNVPEVRVVILTTSSRAVAERVRSRPWITVVDFEDPSKLRAGVARLRTELGIERISAIGGRGAATSLIDAGVVQDLYLTTSAISAGTPGTPFYTGKNPPPRELVVRKQNPQGVLFEHFVLG